MSRDRRFGTRLRGYFGAGALSQYPSGLRYGRWSISRKALLHIGLRTPLQTRTRRGIMWLKLFSGWLERYERRPEETQRSAERHWARTGRSIFVRPAGF